MVRAYSFVIMVLLLRYVITNTLLASSARAALHHTHHAHTPSWQRSTVCLLPPRRRRATHPKLINQVINIMQCNDLLTIVKFSACFLHAGGVPPPMLRRVFDWAAPAMGQLGGPPTLTARSVQAALYCSADTLASILQTALAVLQDMAKAGAGARSSQSVLIL